MFSKICLLINTVKYLKPIQIFYQIYYRLLPYRNLSFYRDKAFHIIDVHFLLFDGNVFPKTNVDKNKKFEFLNLEKKFDADIDWDFQEFGKLWNYNLQYFNFLNNSSLPTNLKLNWLSDIGLWLNDGRLKLEPYPVSLRIMNVIRFCSAEKILERNILADLEAQAKYLENHLEYHLLGNHLLENAFALAMAGQFFKNPKCKSKAESILYQQLDEQILEDGGHFELSPMYHQIVLFRLLELIDWYSKENENSDFLKFLEYKAQQMCSFLKQITFLNGDIPHFNDSTVNIALRSEQLLAYAETLNIGDLPKIKLEKSGIRVFDYPSYKCMVDVGAIGPTYQPGHSHADALAFILYYNKLPLFVEVGTSTYQIGDRRNFERSTSAHNTVVIADTNQSQVWGGFRAGNRAKVKIVEDNSKILIAEHNGYAAQFGVIHERSFKFFDDNILIMDEIGHEVGVANFHLHPDCDAELIDGEIVFNALNIIILFTGATLVSLVDYDYADGFNYYRPSQKIVVHFEKSLTTQIKILK